MKPSKACLQTSFACSCNLRLLQQSSVATIEDCCKAMVEAEWERSKMISQKKISDLYKEYNSFTDRKSTAAHSLGMYLLNSALPTNACTRREVMLQLGLPDGDGSFCRKNIDKLARDFLREANTIADKADKEYYDRLGIY